MKYCFLSNFYVTLFKGQIKKLSSQYIGVDY